MFVLFRTQEWSKLNLHFHEEQEILLTLSGDGEMYINNEVYPIRRGSLFVINNTDFHRSVGKDNEVPYQFCLIHFDPEEVKGVSTANFDLAACFRDHRNINHRCQLGEDELEGLLKLIKRLAYYLDPECSAYGREVYSKICLSEILIYINSLYEPTMKTSRLQRSEKSPDRITPVIQYIQEHYAEDLSLDSLADMFFISKSHL